MASMLRPLARVRLQRAAPAARLLSTAITSSLMRGASVPAAQVRVGVLPRTPMRFLASSPPELTMDVAKAITQMTIMQLDNETMMYNQSLKQIRVGFCQEA
jgi:hypothetical protein